MGLIRRLTGRMFMVRALVALMLGASLEAGASYCTTDMIPSNTTYMQFTKEPVPEEYGYPNQFKGIHCCVKGYRSIEWYKDGLAYPWSDGWSRMILYPEAANQTLYVRNAQRSDAGDYVCRISNRTHTQEHRIKLQILKKKTDAPRMMYVSPGQSVEEGKPLRLFCEAILGRPFLADARSDLRWRREGSNGTEIDLLPTQHERNVSRMDVTSIRGSYLTVASVAAQDYGSYVCVATSNSVTVRNYVVVSRPIPEEDETAWHADGVPWRGLLLGAAGLLILGATALVLHRRCTSQLRLLARQLRAVIATQAQWARVLEKEFDVLVCWTPIDRELVRGALLPTLQLKYRYRVLPIQVSTDVEAWYRELQTECGRCRSLVAVVSPSQHSAPELLMALRQLRALPLPPVVVLLQDLPDLRQEAKDSGETLVDLIRRMRMVPWRQVQDAEFWTALRLALPLPPMPRPDCPYLAMQRESDESMHGTFSTGSQTALV